MAGTDVLLVAVLGGLIVAAAILGAAEAALLRVQRVRIEVLAAGGDRRASMVLTLVSDLPLVLNTVLLVVLLVQISAATVTGTLASRLFGSLVVTIASFILTLVLFVYTEAIPKTYAVRHPESVALATAPLLRILVLVLRPLVGLLVRFADFQAPGTGIASPAAPTEEELLRLASDAVEVGTIDEEDRLLIDRVFDLGDRRVHEVMVPRLDIVGIPSSASVREALERAIASGHRRIPVYQGDFDDIVGVVRLQALAVAALESPDANVASIAETPLAVPESRRITELLDDMQQSNIHLAIVVAEHGGTEGIVTIEDVVSQLVGRISDEGEHAAPEVRKLDATTWEIAGSTDVTDLSKELGIELPTGDWTTAAGMVIAHAGRFPEVGETFEFDGATIEVAASGANRITLLRVTRVDRS